MGPLVWRPVLDPLAAYTSSTFYTYILYVFQLVVCFNLNYLSQFCRKYFLHLILNVLWLSKLLGLKEQAIDDEISINLKVVIYIGSFQLR